MPPYQFLDQARRVALINEDGSPYTGGTGGGATSPNAPTQVATASGANGTSRLPVTVSTSSVPVVGANATARVVAVAHAGGANVVYLALGRAATVNDIPLYPGGLYESPTPITGAINGITSTGSEVVTATEFL